MHASRRVFARPRALVSQAVNAVVVPSTSVYVRLLESTSVLMRLLPWLASYIPHSGLLKCGNTWMVCPTPTSPRQKLRQRLRQGLWILVLLLQPVIFSCCFFMPLLLLLKASGGLNTLPLPGRVLSSLSQCRKSTSETNSVSQVEQ